MSDLGVVGIVTEYNPFHNGHAWMIEQLRQQGAQAVVVAMSSCFVQRGQPAFLPTYVRAQAALYGGADLVLRLPVAYASASAEPFAVAATGMLAALGCVDTIAFGAENADTQRLIQVAEVLQSEAFTATIKAELAKGDSFAAARAKAADSILPGTAHVLRTPNNILGIEYCKALQTKVPNALQIAANKMPKLYAIARKGAQHDGVPADGIASASWLRQCATESRISSLQGWVPPMCYTPYEEAVLQGESIDERRWEIAFLSRLRGKGVEDFVPYCGQREEGLAARIHKAAQVAVTVEEVYEIAKTKRFAHSRVRRAALGAALQLPVDVPAVPPFLQVLAANEQGLAVLKEAKSHAILPISTSLAELENTGEEARRIIKAEVACEDIYALCQHRPQPGGRAYTQPAFIVKAKK